VAYIQTGNSEQQRKALQIKADFQRHLDRVRADTSLSDSGKRAMIQSYHDEYTRELATLEGDESRALANRKLKLERDLFGLAGISDSSTAISYRDAQDRVAALDSGAQNEALRLLSQAERSGDTHLAKAVALRAFSKSSGSTCSTPTPICTPARSPRCRSSSTCSPAAPRPASQ
jgi:hypothetical protein